MYAHTLKIKNLIRLFVMINGIKYTCNLSELYWEIYIHNLIDWI